MGDAAATEELTELVDADITNVDGVKGGANGTRFLMAKGADDQPTGLFAPEFVRDLVTKADAEAEPTPAASDPATVTMTGRPESIAAVMHKMHEAAVMSAEVQKAAADHAEYVALVKAKYSAEDKRQLGAKGHAMSVGDGEYDYPIDDAEDLGKAIHAVGRGGADHDKIRAYIIRRARAMGMSDQVPDNWASDGSLKQAAMAKADGYTDPGMAADTPGSPAWEAQDADTADGLVQAILALRPRIQAFAQREGAEIGNGDMGDLGDVCDLQTAKDFLMSAAKIIGGVAVAERAEAGNADAVTKADGEPTPPPAASAAPSPQESTVSDTQGGAAATTETTATADVAKGGEGALTEAQLAELGRQFLAKAAKKKAKKTSGAAGAPADNARVIPGTDTVQSPAQGQDDVTKAAAAQLTAAFSEAMAPVTKQLAELVTTAESQQARVEKALAQPDDRRSPALNGATGVAGIAPGHFGNGFERTPAFEPVRKALDALPDGPEKEQAQTQVALAAIRGRFGN